jgi:hypothetical protein
VRHCNGGNENRYLSNAGINSSGRKSFPKRIMTAPAGTAGILVGMWQCPSDSLCAEGFGRIQIVPAAKMTSILSGGFLGAVPPAGNAACIGANQEDFGSRTVMVEPCP